MEYKVMRYFLFLLLVGMMILYIPHTGGAGVNLPWNLVFLAWVSITFIYFIYKKNIFATPSGQPMIILGCVFLSLPWLLHIQEDCGVVILLLAFGGWWVINRILFSEESRRFILLAVFLLAFFQSIVALIQIFEPNLAAHFYEYNWIRNHGRPYGIFQQANLLGSFLASGIGCGFLLLHLEQRKFSAIGLIFGLGLVTFTLALNQSRAGAIGVLLVLVALTLLNGCQHIRRTIASLAIIIMSAGFGWYVTQHVTLTVNGQMYILARVYHESNYERWKIIAITWQMIKEKIIFGWGYGNFEYAFSRWVLARPTLPYQYSSIVTHPHNELLNMWFEGGIVALSGVVLLLAGWGIIVMRAWKRSRTACAYSLLILPLLVHLNLEYPFYQSFIHLGLFVLLLRLGVPDNRHVQLSLIPLYQKGMILASSTMVLVFSITGLYANHELTCLERAGLAGFPQHTPWYWATQFERSRFDGMVALLVNYNHTKNTEKLIQFMQLAEGWSLHHNDKNVWNSMIRITQFRGDIEKAARLNALYQKLFPLQKDVSNATKIYTTNKEKLE